MLVLKKCEFCNEEINTNLNIKRFCNNLCQSKNYNQRPEIKEKSRLRIKEYRKNNPEWKEKHRILAVTKYKEQRKEYWENYGKRPEVKSKINKKARERRMNDQKYAIKDRLRRSLRHALTKYSKTGKIMSSKKYGLSWEKIIKSLKPFPNKLNEFEIDHIKPLHSFDLTKDEEIKLAFSPSNLQWLTREENRRKSGKILIEERGINCMELLNKGNLR